MGLTLLPKPGHKQYVPVALLEFPILIALLLSLGIHLLIWKVLPDIDPLPQGKSHGWMRVLLLEDASSLAFKTAPESQTQTSSKNNNSSKPDPISQLPDPSEVQTNHPPLAHTEAANLATPSNSYQSPFSSGSNGARQAALEQEMQMKIRTQLESRIRAEALQRQALVQQNLSLFAAQKQQQPNAFACELAFSGDFSQGFVKCNLPQFEQEIQASLAFARITWQDNKNGLVNERIIGQATLIKP
jgi:hypothetical protein